MKNAVVAEAPLYSPLPPEAYSRPSGKGRAGVGFELRAPAARPLWNLYWLSEPKLDEFLTGGPRSLIDLRLVRACRLALDQAVAGKLVGEWMHHYHPIAFAGALQSKHKHLEPYKLLGAQWVEIVSARAWICRGLVAANGPVHYANFGGKEVDVTLAGNSARIMTLAFKKN